MARLRVGASAARLVARAPCIRAPCQHMLSPCLVQNSARQHRGAATWLIYEHWLLGCCPAEVNDAWRASSLAGAALWCQEAHLSGCSRNKHNTKVSLLKPKTMSVCTRTELGRVHGHSDHFERNRRGSRRAKRNVAMSNGLRQSNGVFVPVIFRAASAR